MSVNNRLLLELENALRNANKDIINPEIPDLSVGMIRPVMEMTARARASYLKLLFDLTKECGAGIPDAEQIAGLANARKTFEELVLASQALDTAIQREYLTISA